MCMNRGTHSRVSHYWLSRKSAWIKSKMATSKCLIDVFRELIEIGRSMRLDGIALLDFVREILDRAKGKEERYERMRSVEIERERILSCHRTRGEEA